MGDPECAHERCHRIDGERGQGGEVEAPSREPCHCFDRGAPRVDVTQHLASGFDQCLTGGGEHDAPPDPVEQRGAELGLQPVSYTHLTLPTILRV